MMTNYSLTEEEWECVRVCVSNAPIPYDISQKEVPANILAKIGEPTPLKGEPLETCLLYTYPSPRDS